MSVDVDITSRMDSVRQLGVGVEYFPGWVHRTLQLHAVNVVLMSFILRGRGRHVIDDESFDESGSSVAVTHYGQRHDIVTDDEGMDIVNVYLDLRGQPLPVLPSPLDGVLGQFLPLDPRFTHRQNRIVRLAFDDPQPVTAPLFSMLRELKDRRAGYETMVRLELKAFLILCCRRILDVGLAPASPPGPLEELRLHLDRNFADRHTLDALAQRAGMRPTSLCRAFKRHTGKRVFDYLIERRVQAAMLRLRSSDDKILAVAMDCGFHDLAHFNRVFKRMLGITPSQYRRGART